MRCWVVVSVIGLMSVGVHGQQAATRTVRATGAAQAPQKYQGARARLMAERGAQVVAARRLAMRLAPEDTARAPGDRSAYRRFSGTLRGHRYHPAIHREDGRAEVTVEVLLPKRPALKGRPEVRDTRAGNSWGPGRIQRPPAGIGREAIMP